MRRVVFYIGLIFTITPVHAQYDYDFLGKGARAAGMAYAFSAIADDATAMSWNPAGIVQIKKPELAFVNSLITTKGGIDDFNYKPSYMIDYMGFVYPLKLKMKDLVLGVSFQNKMNYKYNYTNKPSLFSKSEGNSNLTVNSISLCGAYSINRFIAIGISYNAWLSMGNKEYKYDEFYYFPENNTLVEPDTTHIYKVNNNDSYSGNNFTAGVMLDFTSIYFPLRFTLKYENKFVLKKNLDETWQQDHVYKEYPDTNWTKKFKGVERDYVPRIITTGISYRLDDYLTVACDLEIRLYNGKYYDWNYKYIVNYTTNSQMTVLEDTVDFGEIAFDEFSSKLNQYRFGIEYILHPKFALIPVRAGWKNNHTSLYDFNKQYTLPKQVNAHSVNFGMGLITKRFSLDCAYEHYKYNRTDEINNQEEKKYNFFLLSAIIYLK